MPKGYRQTFAEFLHRSVERHGPKYDYSKAKEEYLNCHSAITITCKEHGDYVQRAYHHLSGTGCPACSRRVSNKNLKRKIANSTDVFLEKAQHVHGLRYDYSKTIYTGSARPVTLVCKVHGDIEMLAGSHLAGHGCQQCGYVAQAAKKLWTKEEFVHKARMVHGDKYDYEAANYQGWDQKLGIHCHAHGLFYQRPNDHTQGSGCPRCAKRWSPSATAWLDAMAQLDHTQIQHAANGGEVSIPGTKFQADGFSKELTKVYEYHGDYWHGNPRIYSPDAINERAKQGMRQLFDKTVAREQKLKELGYNVESIWEDEWEVVKTLATLRQSPTGNKRPAITRTR